MYCSVLSATVSGMEMIPVQVEADVSDGMPQFTMVGYVSAQVKEAQDRVRTALKNMGISLPPKRITINLSPADVRKEGSRFDLPIAAGVLMTLGRIPPRSLRKTMVLGELGLDGHVQEISGVFPAAAKARELGCTTLLVPAGNAAEGGLVGGLHVVGIQNLQELLNYCCEGKMPSLPSIENQKKEDGKEPDFSEVQGQTAARRAALIAAAGFHNLLMLGPPGSGKSMSCKSEIVSVFLCTPDDVYICDPEAEYYPLVKRLHGQVVKLSPTSKSYVNPLDINLNYSEDENPLALKSDFVLSFCELVMGGKNGLEAIEKTIIDRAVQVIYRPYLADPRPENMPILSDLHQALLDQHIPEADRVAQALDLYVSGSLNVFNHRTNIDIQNRIVAFDIKELGKQLKKLGMLIVQDQIWGRVTQNRSQGKATWYFCDEFHLLLREEQTAAFSCEIWKRFRKWGGIPTGATQNVKDLLSSPEIENILENSDFICMLNQAAGDRKILAERLNISPEQLKFVTNSPPGEGLLFFENVILPFADKFPRDTELYRIMSTKPSEVNGV